MQEKEMYELMYQEIEKARARKLARLKKRRQKEFFKTVLIIAMMLYIAIDFFSCLKANRRELVKVQEEYTVSSGDTLWSIASSLENAKEDIRDIIYRVDKENGCGKYLIPGEKLILTYYK